MTKSEQQTPRGPRPPVWQMVREAIDALGPETTNVAVREWILQHYPGTNKTTISCHITVCTVNHESRVHYAQNARCRIAKAKYDFLYRPERGRLVLYDPSKHGQWEICKGDDGRLRVGLVGECDDGSEDGTARATDGPAVGVADEAKPGQFALETHLRDFVAQNLELVEPGLELYVDDAADVTGVEYATPIGRIDILAVDWRGSFVVFEFKVSRGSDTACGQILRYMSWVKSHLAHGAYVRGVIVANKITQRLRYAAAMVHLISLMEYELDFKLSPIESHEDSGDSCA